MIESVAEPDIELRRAATSSSFCNFFICHPEIRDGRARSATVNRPISTAQFVDPF